jgi:hypothetical protein
MQIKFGINDLKFSTTVTEKQRAIAWAGAIAFAESAALALRPAHSLCPILLTEKEARSGNLRHRAWCHGFNEMRRALAERLAHRYARAARDGGGDVPSASLSMSAASSVSGWHDMTDEMQEDAEAGATTLIALIAPALMAPDAHPALRRLKPTEAGLWRDGYQQAREGIFNRIAQIDDDDDPNSH